MIDTENFKYTDVTKEIIGAFYTVYNSLGHGFLERVYENALFIELESLGLSVTKQERLKVYYEDEEVGEYFADLVG